MVGIKMYMSEISKFKISDLKPQKITILWTLKHVSAISKHPVYLIFRFRLTYQFTEIFHVLSKGPVLNRKDFEIAG